MSSELLLCSRFCCCYCFDFFASVWIAHGVMLWVVSKMMDIGAPQCMQTKMFADPISHVWYRKVCTHQTYSTTPRTSIYRTLTVYRYFCGLLDLCIRGKKRGGKRRGKMKGKGRNERKEKGEREEKGAEKWITPYCFLWSTLSTATYNKIAKPHLPITEQVAWVPLFNRPSHPHTYRSMQVHQWYTIMMI